MPTCLRVGAVYHYHYHRIHYQRVQTLSINESLSYLMALLTNYSSLVES